MKPWLPVIARTLAGLAGGYLLGAVVAVVLAKIWPAGRLDAALIGGMIGFVVHAVAVIWAFAARTALRACLGILVPAAMFAALAQVIR